MNMERGHLSILARNSYHVQTVRRIQPDGFDIQTKEVGSNDALMRGRGWSPSRYMRALLKNSFYYACLIKEIVCTNITYVLA